MKEEQKQNAPKNTKVDTSEDKVNKIQHLAALLRNKILLTMQAHDVTFGEGLTALTEAVWVICEKFDEAPPINENEPKALDLFIEALKIIDNGKK